MKTTLGWMIGTALLMGPAWGYACSIGCGDFTEISAGENPMPANTPYLHFSFDKATQADEPLSLKAGGVDVPFTREGCCSIQPDDGWQPNTTYTVERSADGCGGVESSTLKETFTTGDVEELPDELGGLSAGETVREKIRLDGADACTIEAEVAYIDVELDLSADAELWQGGLLIETFINGEPWKKAEGYGSVYKPGETWRGYGKDRAFVLCDEQFPQYAPYGLTEGTHEIQMVGTIPGTGVRLESNVVTVDLFCNPPAPEEEDSSCSTGAGIPTALTLLLLAAFRRRRHA